MPPFDASKDRMLEHIKTIQEHDNGSEISVAIHSYDGGVPSLGMLRTFGGGRPSRLGRLTWGEAHALWAALSDVFGPDSPHAHGSFNTDPKDR